jgi:hypothetical protein
MAIFVKESSPVFCYCLLLTKKHRLSSVTAFYLQRNSLLSTLFLKNVQSVSFLQSLNYLWSHKSTAGRLHLKCDGTRAETIFRLSAKRMSPFKSAGATVQSTTGSRGVRIGGSNAGYTMFWGSVKSTGYPLHLPISPLLPLLCVTVCHHISTRL